MTETLLAIGYAILMIMVIVDRIQYRHKVKKYCKNCEYNKEYK